MFGNKKSRFIAAVLCAVIIVMNASMAFAAPYNYYNVEDIRSKALSNYLSSKNTPVLGMVVEAPQVEVVCEYVEETVIETVSYNTVKRLNSSLAVGETVTVREGEAGEKAVVYSVKYENGKEVSRTVVNTYISKAPVDRIVEYGAENDSVNLVTTDSTPARASFEYSYYIDCEATAYDMSPEENGGYAGQTATGVPLEKGVIAVDPKVIPLGSRVYVEAIDGSWSYGYAVAADTGGAIKGKRVDLCFRTQYECRQFGRKACRVYILK